MFLGQELPHNPKLVLRFPLKLDENGEKFWNVIWRAKIPIRMFFFFFAKLLVEKSTSMEGFAIGERILTLQECKRTRLSFSSF